MTRNNADFQEGGSNHTITYTYEPEATDRKGYTVPQHYFQMKDSRNNLLGHFSMFGDGTIAQIETHPEVRRQGIATRLYEAAKQASQTNPKIPTPRHSSSRTPSGSAWASSVSKSEGTEIAPASSNVSQDTYSMHGSHWEMMLPLDRGEN